MKKILSDALAAVSRVGIDGIANGASESVPDPRSRRYAILLADYPTGGEVDYQIAALLPDGQLVDLDSFQARYGDESNIVEALRAAGNLDQHPMDADVRALQQRLAGSSELSGVWLFVGTFRDVVSSFAPYQHSVALRELQRQAHSGGIRVAVALSVVDVGLDIAAVDPSAVVDQALGQCGP